MRKSSWSAILTQTQAMDLSQSLVLLRSELQASGLARAAASLGSHLPGCQILWESLLLALREDGDFGDAMLQKSLCFLRELYKELKIHPEDLPYLLIRPEVLVVTLMTLLEIASQTVRLLSSSPSVVTLQLITSHIDVVQELLFLFELCLRKYQSELQLSPQATSLCSSALEIVHACIPLLINSLDSPLLKPALECTIRVLLSAGAYVHSISSVGAGSEALSSLLGQILALHRSTCESPGGMRLLNFPIDPIVHTCRNCVRGCRICKGPDMSLRLALIFCIVPSNEVFFNGQVKMQTLALLKEATNCPSLSLSSRLNYSFCYLSINQENETLEGLLGLLGKLFRIMRDASDTDQEASSYLPRHAAPEELEKFSSYLLTILAIKVDHSGLLPAFIDFAFLMEGETQNKIFTMLLSILCNSTENRFACAKMNGLKKLLEYFPYPDSVSQCVARLCEVALYPHELETLLSRLNISLRTPQNFPEVRNCFALLKRAFEVPQPFGTYFRASGSGAKWKLDGEVYFCSAVDATASLGGLSVILPIFDLIREVDQEYEEIRVLLLSLIYGGKKLLTETFVKFLSVELEQSATLCPFSEDSILLLAQIFFEAQCSFTVAAKSLVLLPKLWENISSELYYSHLVPVLLNCINHFYSDKNYAEALGASRVLLNEIWRRKDYEPLMGSPRKELSNMISSALVDSQSEELLYEWFAYALESLSKDIEKSCDLCALVCAAVESSKRIKRRFEKMIAIVKEFAARLEGMPGHQKLTTLLANTLYHTCLPEHFVFHPMTAKFSKCAGVSAFVPLMQRLIQELDLETYSIFAKVIREEWLSESRSARRRPEDLTDNKLIALTSLMAKCTVDSFWDCWRDFCSFVEMDSFKLAAQPNFPQWVVGAFDRAVMLEQPDLITAQFWPIIVKVFLQKSAGNLISALRQFIYQFWTLDRPEARRHFSTFLKIFVKAISSTALSTYAFIRDLFSIFEEVVLEQQPLAADLGDILLDPEVTAYLKQQQVADDIMPVFPYEKVFNFTEESLAPRERSSAGGLRRLLITLAVSYLRVSNDAKPIINIMENLKNSFLPKGKVPEDLFKSDGFFEALIFVELSTFALEVSPEERSAALSVLLHFIESDAFIRVKSLFNDSDETFAVYRELVCKHVVPFFGTDPQFQCFDSFHRKSGFMPHSWIDELESSREYDSSLQLCIFVQQLNSMRSAANIDALWTIVMNEEWQEAVLLYLLVNTRLRLNFLSRQALSFKAAFQFKQSLQPSEDTASEDSESASLASRAQKQEKMQLLDRMHLRYQWKSHKKLFTEVYGIWQMQEESNYWKLENFVDKEGRRTRIKRKKNAESHEDAVNRRSPGNASRPTSQRKEAKMCTALIIDSPSLSEFSENSSSQPASRMSFDFGAGFTIGSEDYQSLTAVKPKKRRTPSECAEIDGERSPFELSLPEVSLEVPCERIMGHLTVYGLLDFSDYVLFRSAERPQNQSEDGNSALITTRREISMLRIWKWEEVQEIWERRFIHKNTAFEIFLRNGKSYFFNCFSQNQLHQVTERAKRHSVKFVCIFNDKYRYRAARDLRGNWLKGSISNFMYLSTLNRLSSRSYNELSQYPVFPWVLKDYESEALNLSTHHVYRDFTQNVGAQLEEGRLEAKRRYQLMEEAGMEPCHFGSHYSTSGIVSYYLVRLEPYVSAAIDLQDRSFDVADRIFASMEIAWKGCLNNSGDFKELVPEFFSLPEALININRYEFGQTQAKVTVEHVALPRWTGASNNASPEERLRDAYNFIRLHERALESPFVRRALSSWIDLIFGYKQKSQRARDFVNVFYSYTYQDKFEKAYMHAPETDREGIRQQVVYYGQTPLLLFRESNPHPQPGLSDIPMFRGVGEGAFGRAWELHIKKVDLGKVAKLFYSQGRFGFVTQKRVVTFIGKKSTNGCYREHSKEVLEEVAMKADAKQKERMFLGRHMEVANGFLLTCFLPHCSFQIHSMETGELLSSVVYHSLPVTCLAAEKSMVAAGSEDCTISLWSVQKVPPKTTPPEKLSKVFYGHRRPVCACVIGLYSDAVVSADVAGMVLIHSVLQSSILAAVAADPSPNLLLAIGRMRLIAVCSPGKPEVLMLTITGQQLPRIPLRTPQDPPKSLMFTKAGDRLMAATSSLAVYNVFPNHTPLQDESVFPLDVQRICMAKSDTILIQTSRGLLMTTNRSEERRADLAQWGLA